MEQGLSGATRASQVLKGLANKYRLLILCELMKRDCSVGELQLLLGQSQPTVSQHLRRLRRMGLVRARREGRCMLYSVATVEAAMLIACVRELAKQSNARFDTPIPAFAEAAAVKSARPVLSDGSDSELSVVNWAS